MSDCRSLRRTRIQSVDRRTIRQRRATCGVQALESIVCYDLELVPTGHIYSPPTHGTAPECWYPMLVHRYGTLGREHYGALYFDCTMQPVGHVLAATGTVDAVNCDPLLFILPIVKLAARRMVLFHNHPTPQPDLAPSDGDIKSTREISLQAGLFRCSVIDHVIVSRNEWTSIAREAELPGWVRRKRGGVVGDET